MTHVYDTNDKILWEWGLIKEVPIFETKKKLEKDKNYKVFVTPGTRLNSIIFSNNNIKKVLKPENADIIVVPKTLSYQKRWWFEKLCTVCQNKQTKRIYLDKPKNSQIEYLMQKDFIKYNKDSIKLLQMLPSLDETKFVTTIDFKNFFSSQTDIDKIIPMLNSEDEDTVNLGISLLGNISLKDNYLKIISLFCPKTYGKLPKLLSYKNKTIIQNILQELKNIFPTFNTNTILVQNIKTIISDKVQKFTTKEYEEIEKIFAESIINRLNGGFQEYIFLLKNYGKEVEIIVDLSFCDSNVTPYKVICPVDKFINKEKIYLADLTGEEGVIIGMLCSNSNDVDELIIKILPKNNYYTYKIHTVLQTGLKINKNDFYSRYTN